MVNAMTKKLKIGTPLIIIISIVVYHGLANHTSELITLPNLERRLG